MVVIGLPEIGVPKAKFRGVYVARSVGNGKWHDLQTIPARSYVCWSCGTEVSPNQGWIATDGTNILGSLLVCHKCNRPTFIDDSGQYPGPPFGEKVENAPELVTKLYDEARIATGSGANTAAVLCCRKLLMQIAVMKGAATGLKFEQYVEYLVTNHIVPEGSKAWVDKIRTKANEANHEINIMSPEEAQQLVKFCEMLLKITFEYPASAKDGG